MRILAGAAEKERARRAQRGTGANPFLPYDPELFVADVSDTHVCLLNKYCVLDDHLLIVTREYADQQAPLDRGDFDALFAGLAGREALGFYNAGEVAGASQPHKHLQLVPAPLGSGPERVPIEPLLELSEGVGAAPRLPFAHALAPTPQDPTAAHALYGELLRAAGAEGRPYNLLVTRAWMLVAPRSRAAWEGVDVNALGFAGALLVRDRERLARLREVGPLALLRNVGISSRAPRSAGR